MRPITPRNEAQRLLALREYQILDTAREQSYDDITTLAASVCHVPIALVSLVDESRQWFKSKIGVDQTETARDLAFCAHAILKPEPLIVNDTRKDGRFAENELVTGEPHIRFYAGFPLISPEGFALGTLCAIDCKPHRLGVEQTRAMQALSRQVMALLELRRVSAHLADALEHVKTLHGLLPICAWCKQVRDDKGYWNQVEAYIQSNSDATVTSGICPECLDKIRPQAMPKDDEREAKS